MTKDTEANTTNSIQQEAKDFWIELARTMVQESLPATEETARQTATIVGVLIGIYSGAITLSAIRSTNLELGLVVLFLSPIVLWLISLMASLAVFWPSKRVMNLQDALGAKEMMESLLLKKYRNIQTSFIFLFAGIILLVVALGVYLAS